MSIRVQRAGLLTTVQDEGRRAQRHGVVRGGVMDRRAARIANLLVGNDAGDALLEATLTGPTLAFDGDHVVALCGADMNALLDGMPAPAWCAFAVPAGSTLELRSAARGCRTYIAVAGGIVVPRVLGSRATDMMAGIGGVDGRALAAGDVLPVRPVTAPVRGARVGPSLTRYVGGSSVRIIDGPEHALFTGESQAALVTQPFIVTAQSNRMGYRLKGAALELRQAREMISAPVAAGTVQVPPSGDPIVLMADGQGIGGYPRIASVITVDLPALAQLPPGVAVSFTRITLDEAQQLCLQEERDMRMLETGLGLR